MLTKCKLTLATVTALALAPAALAENTAQESVPGRQEARGLDTGQSHPGDGMRDDDERAEAGELVEEARRVVEEMQEDPELANVLDRAHGIFIVPDYARAAAVIGGRGGEGVVLLREHGAAGAWSAPAFFDFGGASLGANVGAKAGSIVMVLMTAEAADKFREEKDPWTLDASAGITIANYSTATEETFGEADIVFWSNTAGAYAGAEVTLNNINSDEEENRAFYGAAVDSRQILSGQASNARADALLEELGEN